MRYFFIRVVVLFVVFASVSGVARAESCRIPLRNVLVAEQDCAYYQTAFRMMATEKVSVNSFCAKGKFSGPNGTSYRSQVLTSLTVHDTTCANLKPLDLNPVLLSKPNCDNLKNVISMLSTDFVNINPLCNYGSWQGADGSARNSMVAARLSMRTTTARK